LSIKVLIAQIRYCLRLDIFDLLLDIDNDYHIQLFLFAFITYVYKEFQLNNTVKTICTVSLTCASTIKVRVMCNSTELFYIMQNTAATYNINTGWPKKK